MVMTVSESTEGHKSADLNKGFMVALFYCFLNTEVQNTLKHHFENWKTKKSLGPSRLRSSSRSKDWSPRSRTESLRITEWTLVGAEDLEDNEHKRLSQAGLHPAPTLNHTKESLLTNHRKESTSRRLYSQPTNLYHKRESCTSDSTATTLVTVNGGPHQGRSPYLQPPRPSYGGNV